MNFKIICKKVINKFSDKFHFIKMKRYELKKIREKKRVNIYKNIKLTKEQKHQIDAFFKENYGKKIPYFWHREYYAISGKFDYKFFPELLFIPGFERLVNDPNYKCLTDKNLIDIIGSNSGIKTPKVYVRCSNGILTDEYRNVLSIDQAYNIIKRIDKFFIKPSVNSNSGRGCKIILSESIKNAEDFKTILNDYKKDFVIQAIIKNSNDISKLNPTSLNTFRVITYILNGNIYHMPIILRIGRYGKIVDNAHQGGLFIGVTDDGKLLKNATTEFNEKYEVHPDTNIRFENYLINNIDKVISAAHKLQSVIPHIGCINWDFTLDDNDDVILIEANMRYGSIWLIQMAHGVSGFGENTAEALKLVRNNKKMF